MPEKSASPSSLPKRHWLWGSAASALAALLAACGVKPPSRTDDSSAATPSGSSNASNPRAYRQDAARHLYGRNAHRIYQGKLPPLLYAVGTLEVNLDRKGQVRSFNWMRAPRHAPEVIREIERTAAQAQVTGADSAVVAAQATVQRIAAELDDSTLLAPRDGRVQFRLAQPGEVLGAGGKVLNVVDLADVYMSFFLPETVAGRVALGSEVRIVLDAAPQFVIPAKVSFVSATAQFTPKTVETASERQKLMFRVKAQIDPQLLQKHLTQVKTGLPGQAWVLAEPGAQWPAHLQVTLPE